MKAPRIAVLTLALAGAAALSSTSLLAADMAPAAHSGHQDQAAAMQARMQTMRARMMEIQRTQDPDKRRQLMDVQMKEMAAMMEDPNHSCPVDEAKAGAVKGNAQDDAMAKRMEMMRMMMPMMVPGAPAK